MNAGIITWPSKGWFLFLLKTLLPMFMLSPCSQILKHKSFIGNLSSHYKFSRALLYWVVSVFWIENIFCDHFVFVLISKYTQPHLKFIHKIFITQIFYDSVAWDLDVTCTSVVDMIAILWHWDSLTCPSNRVNKIASDFVQKLLGSMNCPTELFFFKKPFWKCNRLWLHIIMYTCSLVRVPNIRRRQQEKSRQQQQL
jgi:hypothetical protein